MSQSSAYRTVDLPAGTIRYRESGAGTPVVFIHGFLVDGRLWDGTVDALASTGEFRCIVPDLPLGSHRLALGADADLTPPGVADLIAELIGACGAERPIVVGNDSGGALAQVLAARRPDVVGALVLTNCDTFESFPPGPFKPLPAIMRIPGASELLALPLRLPALTRRAYRPFSKRPIPPDLVDSWIKPLLNDAGVRRDTTKFLVGMNKRHTLAAAERLRNFDRPALIGWAPEDRTFALADGQRLAAVIPGAELVEIPDAGTFVPWDQPGKVAELIAEVGRRLGSG